MLIFFFTLYWNHSTCCSLIWPQIMFLIFMRNTVNVIINCSSGFHSSWIANWDNYYLIHTDCCMQLGNFYIAAGFDLNLKAILKNNDKLWNKELWLCIKTTPNKIVHYSAFFTVNMSKLSFRLLRYSRFKSVKCFFNTTWFLANLGECEVPGGCCEEVPEAGWR